jgi:ornithine decarboxylase
MKEAKKAGLDLNLLDIGGGLPVQYNGKQVDCMKIIEAVRDALDEHIPQNVKIIAEPGRFIVGDAAVLLMKVVGKSKRNGVIWYYLDDGTYNSLVDVHVSKWKFEFLTSRRGKKIRSVLAGPTCDSYDVISKSEWLPELELNDLLIVPNAGAYTSALATNFNGFNPAKTVFID